MEANYISFIIPRLYYVYFQRELQSMKLKRETFLPGISEFCKVP